MPDYSLCSLEPKPLEQCKTCLRNPDIVPHRSAWQAWITPEVVATCDYYVPVNPSKKET